LVFRAGQNFNTMKYIFSTLLLFCLITAKAQSSESRNLPNFDEITVSMGIELVAQKGSENSIELEVSRIDLDDVITEVRGDRLYIKLTNGRHRGNRVKATLTYAEDLEEINVSTSAKVNFRSILEVDDIQVKTSTSGLVELEVKASSVDLGATTSGTIRIEGISDEVDASASTGGYINALDLEANDGYARANTGADVKLNVSDKLRASAGTGGTVRYAGKPRTDISTNTGGSVKRSR